MGTMIKTEALNPAEAISRLIFATEQERFHTLTDARVAAYEKTLEPPKDAYQAPSKVPIQFNPYDKYSRRASLSPKENSEFSDICKHGALQLIGCYREHNRFYSAYDFWIMCSFCPNRYDSRTRFNFLHSDARFNGSVLLDKYGVYIEDDACAEPFAFVYFVSDGNYVKIGMAKDPLKRLGGIQTGNPNEVELLYLIPCKSGPAARDLEVELHLLYQDYAKRGEWFDILDKINNNSMRLYFAPKYWLKDWGD